MGNALIQQFLIRLRGLSAPTRLALIAACLVVVHPWLGVACALGSAWVYASEPLGGQRAQENLSQYSAWWFMVPVAAGIKAILTGYAVPPDDLLRHLSAWQIGFDYRSQYPWSDIPKENLWLGFDYLLGALQQTGLSKTATLFLVQGTAYLATAGVLYLTLLKAVPAHRRNHAIILIYSSIGLVAAAPRALLGRPEGFLLIIGLSSFLVKTKTQTVAWIFAFVLTIPFYWLGWVYAPFALLLPIKSFKIRLATAVGLASAHLVFWQVYSGSYLKLMIWLYSSLSVLATENLPLTISLELVVGLVFILLITAAASLAGRHQRLKSLRKISPVGLLAAWFLLPNQIRYFPALVLVTLPWITLKTHSWLETRKFHTNFVVSPVLVAGVLAMASFLQIPHYPPQANVALPSKARVYSEQPFTTIYFNEPGIAVEPSFAFGATKPEWRGILKDGKANCKLLVAGEFTHLIEYSLIEIPSCAKLKEIHGTVRVWEIKR